MKKIKLVNVLVLSLFTGMILFSILTNKAAAKVAMHQIKSKFNIETTK